MQYRSLAMATAVFCVLACRSGPGAAQQIPPNMPPVAVDDFFSATEGAPVTGNLLANDVDAEGDAIELVSSTLPDVSESGDFTYTPAILGEGQVRVESFTYSITAAGQGASARILFEVQPAVDNRPPIAVDDGFDVTAGTTVTGNLLANDFDLDDDPLTLVAVTDPPAGFTWMTDGSFTYAIPENASIFIRFTYRVSDGVAESSGVVTFAVSPPGMTPPAADAVIQEFRDFLCRAYDLNC